MKRTWLNSGILILAIAFLLSCGSNEAEEAEKRTEITQIIDGMSTKDVLNQLYIYSVKATQKPWHVYYCVLLLALIEFVKEKQQLHLNFQSA